MKRPALAAFLLLGLALVAPLRGDADPAARIPGPVADTTLSPYFFVENGDPDVDRLPLKGTHVDIRVAGVIADVVVTQVYRNEGAHPLNVRYLFPASTRAAVQGMSLQVGTRVVRAKIRERERARRELARAQAAGKSAALLEQQRPNVFSMRLANVLPQDEIQVELHYTELLIPTAGVYELVYPTVVGPRYSREGKGATVATKAPEVILAFTVSPAPVPLVRPILCIPTRRAGVTPPSTFSLDVRLAAGLPISDLESPTHKTLVDWKGLSAAQVALAPEEQNGGDRDFILRYRLQGKEVQTGLLLYPGANDSDEKFFLLMMQPPRRVAPERIPPREYVFVLDVSGSMYGFPMATAKALMRELVGGLRPIDRFNVVLFAGGSRLLSPRSRPATRDNLEWALAEIDGQQGNGGTELELALSRALDLPGNERVSRTTLVITDGFIDAEASVFDKIRRNLGRSNLFAFGIGSSVNRHLIEGMAAAGRGEPFVVTQPEEAVGAADRFREYVLSPVLTDIQVEREGFDVADVEPPAVPDLFADRPLIVFGKWRGEAKGTFKVTGVGGDGPFEQVVDVSTADVSADHSALRALWARERVRRLADYGFGITDEARQEIVGLGLKYELLTPFTSFIAVHEEIRNPDWPAKPVDQPQPMPQGVSDGALGAEVPEPEMALLILLVLALVLRTVLRGTRQEAERAAQYHDDVPSARD